MKHTPKDYRYIAIKKIVVIVLLNFLYPAFSYSQSAQSGVQYQIKSKLIVIDAPQVSLTVDGYNGNVLLLQTDTDVITHQRNPINVQVLQDDADCFSIRLLKGNCKHITVKVPENAYLKASFNVGIPDAKVSFSNLDNGLEVKGSCPVILFDNVSGPLTISAAFSVQGLGAYDKIIVSHFKLPKLNDKEKGLTPLLNIITSNADVDISLPENIDATIQTDIPYGTLYSDLEITQDKNALPLKGRYTGIINNGCCNVINISSTYGNIFLRKQK